MRKLALLVFLTACQRTTSGEDAAIPQAAPVPVRTLELQASRQPRTERRTARTEPSRQVVLAFGVPGRVRTLRPEKGDRVKAGAVLGSIDTSALEASAEAAAAAVEQGERELGRAAKLRETNSIPPQAVDERGSQVRLAKAQLAGVQAQLEQSKIVAPFDGEVVERMMEPGAWANPGAPALLLAVLDPIRVVAHVTDATRVLIQPGAATEIEAQGLDVPRKGKVSRVGLVADVRTGLFQVEIDVPNPDRRLAAGQPVEVSIDCGDLAEVYAIDPAWVVYRYDGPSVVVLDDGRARTVSLGEAQNLDGRLVVPLERLPRLPLIIEGQHFVREGGEVQVQPRGNQ